LPLCAGVQIGKRQEEERDMARYALRNPWWTLSNFDATRKATALQGDAKSVHWQLSEAATAASTASVTGFNYKEPKTEQEVGGLSWLGHSDQILSAETGVKMQSKYAGCGRDMGSCNKHDIRVLGAWMVVWACHECPRFS
jgi:hypothetical protein